MTCTKCGRKIRDTQDWGGTSAKPLCVRCAGLPAKAAEKKASE